MSYLTLEVKIDHGKVIAKEPHLLPEKAKCYLIILNSENREQHIFLSGQSQKEDAAGG